jgi:hypothetical protein
MRQRAAQGAGGVVLERLSDGSVFNQLAALNRSPVDRIHPTEAGESLVEHQEPLFSVPSPCQVDIEYVH